MKNSILNLGITAMLIGGVLLSSCSNDDGNRGNDGTNIVVDPVLDGINKGVLNGTIAKDITLDPSKQYKLTGTFLVEKGVKLTIPAGTNIVADAGTDVYIAILKGAQIFVNGTPKNPVIMTSANKNPGDWGGLVIAGDAATTAGVNATAEVGQIIYGGTNNADNSGKIENLFLNFAGAQINPESQFNGLTLYAVGSGTIIKNVALLNGTDDGVEFFGGAVSATNLYFENNLDDSIDWTEGWNGTITNAYIVHTISGFSTVIEADKNNGNPKIINLTAISTEGGTALQFKKQSGATLTGLSLSGYDTNIEMKDQGPLSNVIIEGASATLEATYDAPATVDITADEWDFIRAKPRVFEVLKGELTANKTLSAAITYNLTGKLIVKDGATLSIPAGTKIIAEDGGTEVYIAVLQGGKIQINGTADNPVVMSSVNAQPSDWGGLTICGKATTTAGIDATAEVGNFIYGGNDATDDSGSIEYLVIKGTGAQINPESQYNGISLYAVGSETKIENIAVINGSDDGIEFFGGTVSATNIYLENNQDDAVDWTEGWNGTVENTYVSHTISGFSTAVEADKDNANPKLINFTAVSTVGGTALQFKKQSGATITNLLIQGYETNIEMKDIGPLSNVIIEDTAATLDGDYSLGTAVDISNWNWKNAGL